MSTLDDIRSAIASAVSVGGVQGYERVPGQVNTPAAVVAPDSVAYNTDFDGGATYTIPVQLLVALGDWASAQKQLDGIISHDGTHVEAINDSTDFEMRVVSMQDYGLTTYAGTDYLGAALLVEVIL